MYRSIISCSRIWNWCRKRIKRPVVWVLSLYLMYLIPVMVIFPKAGERIYGWDRQMEKAASLLGSDDSPKEVSVEAMVLDRKKSTFGFRYLLRLCEDRRLKCYMYSEDRMDPGDRILVVGKASWPSKPMNPGEWDQTAYDKRQHVVCNLEPSEIKLLSSDRHSVLFLTACSRDAVTERIQDLWESPYDGILAAMLTGERGILPEEERELFSKGGIAHVIAISGLHFSLLASIISGALEKIMKQEKARILTILMMALFAFWSGGSVSSLRAAIMFSVKAWSEIKGRDHDFASAMSLSALIILLLDPFRILDSSFYLSYGALIGIQVGEPILLSMRKIPYRISKLMGSSVGACLVTLPLTLYFFFEASPFGSLINLWVIPATKLVMITAILALILSLLHPGFSLIFVRISEWLLKGFGSLSSLAGSDPRMMLRGKPSVVAMILFYGGLILRLRLRSERPDEKKEIRRWILPAVVTLFCILTWLGPRITRKTVSFLYVGQGDCSVIEWKNKVILVDEGTEYEKVIAPYMKYKGIHAIDILVITHPDNDHIDGALRMMQNNDFEVRSVWISKAEIQQTDKMELLEQLCLERGTEICPVDQGDLVRGNDWQMTVLSSRKEYEDINDSSLVISLKLGNHRLLFPGDITFLAESDMLEESSDQFKKLYQADVLKAAHHGSDTSSSDAFLEAVDPQYVIFSCGIDNKFHHPSPETVERVEAIGAGWTATKEDGCITLKLNRKKIRIIKYRDNGQDK